jgi:radical SAM protein with 4Fe4S-binding SPASM domain
MCYQDRTALAGYKELTLEQIIDFFEHNSYLRKVTLIGGEIFVRRDMVDLIRYLNRSREIIISTNGTLIGDSEIDALRRCRRISTICISLDGPKLIHESIRRVRGSYDKTVRTIKALAQAIPVTVTCVIQEDNLVLLPEFVDLCADMGVKKVKFELERIYPDEKISRALLNAGPGSVNIPISPMGLARGYLIETFRTKLRESLSRGQKKGVYVTFDPQFLIGEIEGCYAGDLRSRYKYVCESFRMATIAPDGSLINCFAIRKPFGNILDAPFDEVWNSDIARSYRKELLRNNLTPSCENCPFMTSFKW